jgi:hypothetical protein
MNLIKNNNLITGDFLKYSISSLESRYNGLCHERRDLQINISVKSRRLPFLDILPRNYEIIEFPDSINDPNTGEVQELLKELENVHRECLDCFWTSEYLKASSRYYSLTIKDFEANLRFYDFWETLNTIQQREFMKYCDKYSNTYISTIKIIDLLKYDKNYLKKVLAFIHESGDAIEIFGEDVSIHE